MKKDSYNVIGVMSGTSLDGLDLCHVHFNLDKKWQFKILHAQTMPYDTFWTKTLEVVIEKNSSEINEIDEAYAMYLSKKINLFIKKNEITDLDAVCSHGHTVFHQPKNKYTLQIGNHPTLASSLGQTVICDFRVQDVQLGGQGAPLVPIGDKLLFSDYDFCINLGGFANISFDDQDQRIAYDLCPVNIVLNHYASKNGFKFDPEGTMAATGNLHDPLLNALNNLEYYQRKYPKSLGLEWVKQVVFPLIDSFDLPVNDALRTFVEHIAIQIISPLSLIPNPTVLVSGGGTYNTFLMNRIIDLSKIEIKIPLEDIIDYKEALIFGFLGVLKLRNEVNCLQSVTGANMDHSSGKIFQP